MKPESLSSAQMSNYAMLQSLANLASSSSLGAPSKSPSQRSVTPPNRNPSPITNPNSLLASMNNSLNKSMTTNTTTPTVSTSSPNSTRNPDFLTMFHLPDLFSNSNLISQLLSSNSTISTHQDQPGTSSSPTVRNNVISKSSLITTANSDGRDIMKNSLLANKDNITVNSSGGKIYHTVNYSTTPSTSNNIVAANRNISTTPVSNNNRQVPVNSTIIKYSGQSGNVTSTQSQPKH